MAEPARVAQDIQALRQEVAALRGEVHALKHISIPDLERHARSAVKAILQLQNAVFWPRAGYDIDENQKLRL